MRNELSLESYDLVIAHGSSADAVLRYIESDVILRALIIDGSHLYTAGERHGRAYRYELMKKNIKILGLLSTATTYDYDTRILQQDLRIDNLLVSYFNASPNFIIDNPSIIAENIVSLASTIIDSQPLS